MHPRSFFSIPLSQLLRSIHCIIPVLIVVILTLSSPVSAGPSSVPINLLLLQSEPSPPAAETPNEKSPFGMNLSEPVPYGQQFVFQNLVMQGGAWTYLGSDYWSAMKAREVEAAGDTDENGYLKGGVTGKMTIIWAAPYDHSGDYVCTWEGTGTIDIDSRNDEAHPDVGLTITANQPGRIAFNISKADGATSIMLKVTENSVSDPIRNIKLFEARFDDGNLETFYPEFLEDWKHFKVLRFMDWGHTNFSVVESWEEYPGKHHITQGFSDPVSYAKMVELSNLLHADGWFCVPMLADDDFVTQMARYLRDNLDPSLNVYIELSNEVWNSTFSADNQANDMATQVGLPEQGFMRDAASYYGYRSAQIHNIFEMEFAKVENAPTFIPITAWQKNGWYPANYSWPHYISQRIGGKSPEAHAIAPYFGGKLGHKDNTSTIESWSVDMVLDQLEFGTYSSQLPRKEGTTLADEASNISSTKSYCDDAGIPKLIAYEGGQHLVDAPGNSPAIQSVFANANRHPRMKDIYLKYYDMCKENGIDMFSSYASVTSYGRSGSWGVKEYSGQPIAEAPKYDALLKWIQDNPVTWNGGEMTWDDQ